MSIGKETEIEDYCADQGRRGDQNFAVGHCSYLGTYLGSLEPALAVSSASSASQWETQLRLRVYVVWGVLIEI